MTDYFDLIFEGTSQGKTWGNIALDDINYFPGATCEYLASTTTPAPTVPPKPDVIKFACDFEKSYCEWTTDPGSRFARQTGTGAKYGSAPLSDVTLKNALGNYVYVGPKTNQGANGILRSSKIDYSQESCLEFWYQLSAEPATLKVSNRNLTDSIELWKRQNYQTADNTWARGNVNLKSNLIGNWLEFEGENSKTGISFKKVKLVI